MQLALESCSLESTGRLLESVSNYRSRWMVILRKNDRIRLIGRLFFYTKVTASNHTYMQCSQYDGLVVIGTWLITRSLLLSSGGINFV